MISKSFETDKTEQNEQKQKVMETISVSVKVMSGSEVSDGVRRGNVHNAGERGAIDRQKSIEIQLAMDNQTHSEDDTDETDKLLIKQKKQNCK